MIHCDCVCTDCGSVFTCSRKPRDPVRCVPCVKVLVAQRRPTKTNPAANLGHGLTAIFVCSCCGISFERGCRGTRVNTKCLDCRLKYQREHMRERNKDPVQVEYRKQYSKERKQYWRDRVKGRFNAIRTRARSKGVEFALTLEQYRRLLDNAKACPGCDTLMDSSPGAPRAGTQSVDRIDPRIGYISENTWILCANCNRIKSDASSAEIRTIARGAREPVPSLPVFAGSLNIKKYWKKKSGAAERGIPFSLKPEECAALLTVPECSYCKVAMIRSEGAGFRGPRPTLVSIDRRDSTRGYAIGNVVAACCRCNAIKLDATPDELDRLADAIDAEIQRRSVLASLAAPALDVPSTVSTLPASDDVVQALSRL